jgi:hypothetical protein
MFFGLCKNIILESNASDKKKRGMRSLSRSFGQSVNHRCLADA